jgi:ATP-dependent Clp protease protease subunit
MATKQTVRDDASQFFETGLFIQARRYHPKFTEVSAEFADELDKALTVLEHINHDPVTIVLSCEGGDVMHGLAIYDRIKASKCHITIVVRGECSSMTTIILQAGDTRHAHSNSLFMYHDGTVSYSAQHKLSKKAWERVHDIQDDTCSKILFDKLSAKDPKLTMKKFKESQVTDVVLTAQEALSKGLIDEIIS